MAYSSNIENHLVALKFDILGNLGEPVKEEMLLFPLSFGISANYLFCLFVSLRFLPMSY